MSGEQRTLSVAEKRAKLAQALKRKASQPVEAPLSFSQQRLWFVDQLDPGSPLYNITVTVRVKGALREELLRRVMDEIVARHEPLRTTFGMRGPEPIQLISPRAEVAPEFYSLDELPGADFQHKIERLVYDQAHTRFDLARGPLFRAAIVRVAPEEHVACFTSHHIVSDGWSVGVVLYELAAGYSRALGKRTAPLPTLSIQYRDFARWQTEKLQGGELEKLMSFWQRELKGAPHTLDLPTDRPRPSRVTYNGTVHRFRFPVSLMESLKELSRREQSTFFMAVLAGYATLLYRYSGQDDMLIGIPVTGRERPETQPLIGYFVNIVVARAKLAGNPTFRELLMRIRKTMLDAYAHQDIPFEKLVEALQPKRVLDRNPLVQVVYLHQNFPLPSNDDSPGLRLEPMEVHPGFSRFELGLRTEQLPDGLECLFEYNTDLFDSATVERLATHLRTLLERAAADPSLRIDDISLLSDRERLQFSERYKGLLSSTPSAETVPSTWQRQVERAPDSTALIHDERTVTYRELDQWSERLGTELIRCGLEPKERVGILVPPSCGLAAAVLAVLKAGGAYVPLSPEDPLRRLVQILRAADARILLTGGQLAVNLADPLQQAARLEHVINVDRVPERNLESVEQGATSCLPLVTPQQLAGVFYATGSAVGPLGTAVEHGQILRYVAAEQDILQIGPDTRHALTSPLQADSTLAEILLPLLTGGSIHIAAPADGLGHGSLAELSKTRRSCIRMNAVELIDGRVPNSGEFSYGVTADFLPGGIGQALILDKSKRLVPIGAPGELYLAGDGIARGYFKPSAAQADRFVDIDLFSSGKIHAFRTGEHARWLPSGGLERLGRQDEQVVIHGYRVVPEEIEAALAEHPQVAECAIVPIASLRAESVQGDGLTDWIAYVVPRPASLLNVDELRGFLDSVLPEFMVPGSFLVLNALPRQADGELDRSALPIPQRLRGVSHRKQLPPQTPTQLAVAAIWEQLLGVEGIGIHDDFFELGGNSLMAMQLINSLRDRWQLSLPLRALFAEPTVANTAQLIDDAVRRGAGAATQPLGRAPEGARLPLSPSQRMLWLMEQFDRHTAFNALLGVRLQGTIDRAAMEESLGELMRRHEILRAAIVTRDGQPEHLLQSLTTVPFAFHDLTELPQDRRELEATRLAEQATLTRFDLAAGYLVRFLLVKLDEDQHVLYGVLHHMVSDGWSFPVLWRELGEIYAAFSQQLPSKLVEPPLQFTDYAYWQNQRDDAESQEQAAYWRERLRGPLPVLDLPTDFPRSVSMHTQPDVCELEIPEPLALALGALGKQEGATIFMTLLAAYLTLLHRYSRQDELIVGTPMANRLSPETRELIGFFATMLPLRCDLSGNPSFVELLGRVRPICIDAFARSEPNWESLASAFQLPEPGRMPLCQAFFTLGEFPEEPFNAGCLHWRPFDLNVVRVSGFDLVLALRERQGSFTGALLYRPDLFRSETVVRLRDSFLELLQGIVANPNAPISQLPLLAPAQRQRVLNDWNNTSSEFPADRCVHELFVEQARRTPESVAIIESGGSTTFQQLNGMADVLAGRLQEVGVKSESLVAVLVERSAEMVAALLGIWKAGGAYLPLDASWPPQRMTGVLRDSSIAAIVTQSKREPQLAKLLAEVSAKITRDIAPHSSQDAITVLTVDQLRHEANDIQRQDSRRPAIVSKPHQLAYVIYTSGSTGPPKGVMIEHRSVVNIVTSFGRSYALASNDRVLQQASVAFDVSVNEIFPILLAGGTLVIPRQEEVADFDRLAAWITEHQISIMGATPSALAELNRRADQLKCLRLVLSGGEALSKFDVDKLVEFATVTNGYGPTETTVCATCFDLRQVNWQDVVTIPIGKPIANYQAYVLDRQLQLVPIGCPGELCISGVGVGRGYLGDAELTREKFVPNPFMKGQRLYRTGDEARWLPEGNLEFLGRLDRQVKIRGFRVELGEVESVLRQLPGVQQAVAVCDNDHRGNARLTAYVVREQSDRANEAIHGELRRQAAEKLPAHMVPSAIMFLAELPLTENGKVDLKRLPKPQLCRPELDVPFVAPRNDIEQKLADIWRDALGIDRVGVLDNFFQLGGHSLLAAQIMHHVQRDLEVAFPYRLFFESPTIDQMARRIATNDQGAMIESGTAHVDPLVPLYPIRDTVPAYCLHSLGGQVHEYSRLARLLGETYPVFGLQSRALLDYRLEQSSWQALASDYAQVIRAHHGGPYQLLGHSAGGVLALAVAEALEQTGAEVQWVALVDTYWDLDEVAVARGAEQDLLGALRGTIQQLAPQMAEMIEPMLQDSELLTAEFFALPHDERIKKVDAWIDGASMLPPGMGDHLRNQLQLYNVHRALVDAYPLPRVRAPLLVVWATESLPGTTPLPRFDWAGCTTGGVQTLELPATHWSILAPPAVDQLVARLVGVVESFDPQPKETK